MQIYLHTRTCSLAVYRHDLQLHETKDIKENLRCPMADNPVSHCTSASIADLLKLHQMALCKHNMWFDPFSQETRHRQWLPGCIRVLLNLSIRWAGVMMMMSETHHWARSLWSLRSDMKPVPRSRTNGVKSGAWWLKTLFKVMEITSSWNRPPVWRTVVPPCG